MTERVGGTEEMSKRVDWKLLKSFGHFERLGLGMLSEWGMRD